METSDFIKMGGLRFTLSDKMGGGCVSSPEDAERVYKYIGDQLKRHKLEDLLLKKGF